MSWITNLAHEAIICGAVQRPDELASLAELVHAREPSTIVEIGSEYGGTLWCWARIATPDALLISVDVRHLSLRKDITVEDQDLVLVQGDSTVPSTMAEVLKVLNGRDVDFLFIDGDHSKEAVWSDWCTFGPQVRKGGVVAFHDIVDPNPGAVKPVWEAIRDSNKYTITEFIGHDRTLVGGLGGIGVVLF